MDKIHKDQVEEKRPDTKEHILDDSLYLQLKNKQN